jgi:protease I
MIIAPIDFRDEEYFEPKAILEKAGHHVTTASTKIGKITGSRGGIAESTMLLSNVNADSFDAVIFVGGQGSYIFDENPQALNIAKVFYNNNKLTTAICHAPIILAKSGVLKAKKATVFPGDSGELTNLGVNYLANQVVIDGNIVTANGPDAATEFGNTIVDILQP